MIKNYTISSLKSILQLPHLDVAQITLNSRQFPAKRRTYDLLASMPKELDTKIIVHYDYIYIISRFLMFSEHVQDAIMKEIASIMDYAKTDSRILGIVMHTDWPLRKDCYKPSINIAKIKEVYSGTLWDPEVSQRLSEVNYEVLTKSLEYFYNRFSAYYGSNFPIKIYLENTTKVPQVETNNPQPGSIESLSNYLRESHTTDLYGLCLDTEHDFAVTGRYLPITEILELSKEFSCMVHLNTIPAKVTPKSLIDRHSETPIYECTQKKFLDYLDYATRLNVFQIPFVREVHEETMFKELEFQHEYYSESV